MTENSNQNSSGEKPIGHDHPLVDEDELDTSPVDEKYRGNWSNIKDDAAAIAGFYKNYKNVPKAHREKAIEIVEEADGHYTDFLAISSMERKVTDGVIRAFNLAVLDSFADEIRKEAQWIQSNLDEGESNPIESYPKESGHKVFQMHVSTISYIEASCYRILRYRIINGKIPDRGKLLQWGSHEDRADIDETELDIESQEVEILSWAESSGVYDLSRALNQSGVIGDKLYNKINQIRERRNNIVHQPSALTLSEFTNSEELLETTRYAVDVCDSFSDEFEKMDRHAIYNTLTEK